MTISTEPIGSIFRPLSLIELVRLTLQRVFIGMISPINPRIETPEEIRGRVLEVTKYIPAHRLGTTDDFGFSPFSDDTSTTRNTAFAKIRARVLGRTLAVQLIAGG